MIHRNTTQIDETTEEFLEASAGLWEILESVLNSFSFSFGNTPHRLYGEQPEGDSADDAGDAPALETNERWDGGEQSPPPPADSLRLDWYGTVPQAISEALNLTFLPKMDELIRQSTECCATITDAIGDLTSVVREIETCCKPAAEAPTKDISRRVDEMEREIRRITERGPNKILDEIRVFQGLFNRFVSRVLGLTALSSNLVALWGAMITELVRDYLRHKSASPRDLKNWSAERRDGLEEMTERYPDSDDSDAIVNPFFAHAWLEWQRALRELIEDIESPDKSPEAERQRDESLRVLPDVLEDLERAMELYRDRHEGREAPFDYQLLDRAKDLLNRTPSEPELHPSPTDENGSDLLSRRSGGSHGRDTDYDNDDFLALASYSTRGDQARSELDQAKERFDRALDIMESVLARMREPVRLEVRVLDDRVIARRLDGNRSVDVDLSRGYRMVGYISV
jgi:hypothetical protein